MGGADSPVPREEFVDAADRVRGDPREDVSQPGERVDAVEFAGFDQAVDGGGAAPSGVGAGKQPVLSAQADAPQRVFGAVVVDFQPAVADEAGLQQLRRHRCAQLRCLEPLHQPTLEDHDHRHARLGTWVLITASWYYLYENDFYQSSRFNI